MKVGMLWFDNDKKATIPTKIERAVEYYREKYEEEPTICYLNPKMLSQANESLSQNKHGEGEKLILGEIEISQNPQILPNHFWIGVHDGNGHV